MAAHDKEESLDEIRESNEAIAARWQVSQELKAVETAELLMIYKKMIRNLSKSRARVAELESVNELQAKKLLQQVTRRYIGFAQRHHRGSQGTEGQLDYPSAYTQSPCPGQ